MLLMHKGDAKGELYVRDWTHLVGETDVRGRGPTRWGRSVPSITKLFPRILDSIDIAR